MNILKKCGCGDSCKGGAANKAPKSCHKELAKVMIMNTTNIARRHFNCLLINKCFQSVLAKEVDDADSRSSVNTPERNAHFIRLHQVCLSFVCQTLIKIKIQLIQNEIPFETKGFVLSV
jgi:hypothetical protein